MGQDVLTQPKVGGIKPWIMAFRPKTLTAALVPVMVATALVRGEGQTVLWWVSICALLSAMCIQIGTNFVNDAIDFEKGADTDKRIGPQRVTQSGLLTGKQVMFGAMCFFFLAFCLGVPLVMQGGWPIIIVGLLSLFLGYGYTGGPFPLAYLGLGDLFVILFFGLIAVGGTYFIHTGHLSPGAFIAGLQIGCLGTVLIAVNNLRDAPQDKLVDKKTLAVRFGTKFARYEIAFLALLPFVLSAYWYNAGLQWAALMPVVTLPLALKVIRGVFKNEPSPLFNKFLGMSAGLQLLFGLLLSIGLWI